MMLWYSRSAADTDADCTSSTEKVFPVEMSTSVSLISGRTMEIFFILPFTVVLLADVKIC